MIALALGPLIDVAVCHLAKQVTFGSGPLQSSAQSLDEANEI